MDMHEIKLMIWVFLLATGGIVSAEPVITVRQAAMPQKQIDDGNRFPSDSEKNNAQTQIEQAADQFDAFALQMPKVINAKLDSFMKHGFRAFLLEDSETKPAEERMIDSLVKGLQALGHSLSEDLAQPDAQPHENHPVKKQPKTQ
jgi:hypothetical protein